MNDPIASDLLAAAAARHPAAMALRGGNESWTYAELDYAADEIGGRVPEGARIAFRAEMTAATVAAAWGIPRGGGIAVPIDPQLDVGAAAALADSLGAHLGPPPPAERKIIADPDPDPRAPAYVVPTSGSSGAPRGVVLTWGNITAAARASQLHLGTRQSDVWLLVMPLHHVSGLAILWRAAHDGSQVVLQDGFDVAAVDAALEEGVTWVSLVPTMLTRLLEAGSGPWPSMRGVLVGGAATSGTLVARATAAGLPVLPTYGMTETTAQICTVRPGRMEAAVGTVGHPLPGVAVTVDAEPGSPGVIQVSGPTVSPGYVDEPVREGPLVTNDIGYFDRAGRLVVLGRADDVVISGGENVYPLQVEAALLRRPGVTGAAVVGVADAEWGQRVVAVVSGDPVDQARLLAELSRELPRYAVPKRVVQVDEVPLLSNGKVDRDAARRLVAGA